MLQQTKKSKDDYKKILSWKECSLDEDCVAEQKPGATKTKQKIYWEI